MKRIIIFLRIYDLKHKKLNLSLKTKSFDSNICTQATRLGMASLIRPNASGFIIKDLFTLGINVNEVKKYRKTYRSNLW